MRCKEIRVRELVKRNRHSEETDRAKIARREGGRETQRKPNTERDRERQREIEDDK